MNNCPTCKELLVFNRNDYPHCEDCGWPDEDFGGEWEYPKEGQQLGDFQPGLQILSKSGIWVQSGVVTATMKAWFRGEYRYPIN